MIDTNLMRRALPLLCALVLACDDGARAPGEADVSARPLPLADGLLYTRTDAPNGHGLVALDLAGTPRASLPVLDSRVVARAQAVPGAATAVVLTAGRAASRDGRTPALPSKVLVVDRTGVVAERVLQGRYGGIALSDDGRFAVAHTPTGSFVLSNAIEVVDLNAPSAVTEVVNLELDGRAPSGFVFAPTAGFERRVLVMSFPGAVMLLDLEHPERGEISIPLSTRTQPGGAPQRILFAGSRVFIQTSGAPEVLALELLAAPETRHGFRPIPSLLAARGPLRDLALSGSGEALRLVALSDRLELLDPARGSAVEVTSAASFSQVLPFEGRTPADDQPGPRALLSQPGATQVAFAELGGDGAWASRALEQVELGAPLSTVVPLAHHALALALHHDARLSVIDLEARTVDPYRLDGALRSFLLDEDPQRARVWVATHTGKLAVLDLRARSAREVPIVPPEPTLDAASAASPLSAGLLLLPGARRRVAVLHASSAGRVTLLDAEAPARESALEVAGFHLAGLFD